VDNFPTPEVGEVVVEEETLLPSVLADSCSIVCLWGQKMYRSGMFAILTRMVVLMSYENWSSRSIYQLFVLRRPCRMYSTILI
jgi:hypothetical protein